MFSLSSASPRHSNVTAYFTDGAQSFPLLAGETMGGLAARIEALAALHADSPIAIQVRFQTSEMQANSAAARH